MATRTAPQFCLSPSRYFSGRLSRPSLRTAGLITRNRMSTGRTFSTSSSHRDVSQAHGQAGSNHMSAVIRSVTAISSGQFRSLLTNQYPYPDMGRCRRDVTCATHRDGRRRERIASSPSTRTARDDAPDLEQMEKKHVPGVRNLTQVEAAERARLLAVEAYDVILDL